jgi:hypothetical protein
MHSAGQPAVALHRDGKLGHQSGIEVAMGVGKHENGAV